MTRKVLINCCLTGMIPTKSKNPHVPITPEEIVKDALTVRRLGASIVHIHARDMNGEPTWDPSIFAEIASGIRESAPDLIICMTTSGRLWNEREKRAAVLLLTDRLRPDMASLTLGSLNFAKHASVNSCDDIIFLLKMMNERGIKPELEVFDLGMIDFSKHLINEGLLQAPYYYNLFLGNRGTVAAIPFTLAMFVERLPFGSVWSGAGIGKDQFSMNCLALAMGGNVRAGLEDNLYLNHEHKQLASNASIVERLVNVARAMEIEVSTPAESRQVLGLNPQ